MKQEDFQKLVTNVTLVLHNYLMLAKQSGRITIILDAVKGEPTRVLVSNTLEIPLKEGEKDA